MDGDRVVLDISSDEDAGFNWAATEGGDSDVDWNELFVNLESDVGDNNKTDPKSDEGYDSDDVVVIGEVLAKPMRAKKILGTQEEEDDDDCMVLEGDPDKQVEEVENLGCDSDDLVIVAEKGQVACRDYPHSRHLCVKFPFRSTLHSDHCNLCHCYVCDSPAPCINWGNGNSATDHCHAFEKEALWESERKKARYEGTTAVPAPAPAVNTAAETAFWKDLLGQIPAHVHPPAHNLGSNGYIPGQLPSYDPPNIIRTQRPPSVLGQSRYQPSQQMLNPLNPCSNNLQRPRIPTLNPQSVTSNPKRPCPTGMATGISFPIPAYKHARSNNSFSAFKHTSSNHLKGIGLSSKQTVTRQLHMGQLNGMVNSNPLHNSSAVNSCQLYAGQFSYGQAQLLHSIIHSSQSPALPVGNPSVHPNGSQNDHISTSISSTDAQYNPSQPDISFTAALNPQGGDQLPLTEAEDQSWNGVNLGLLETQGLHDLPVLDPEDGIYADNLWNF